MSILDKDIDAVAIIISTKGNKGADLVRKAESFKTLRKNHSLIAEISEITRIDPTSVVRYLKIAELPSEVKQLILEREIDSYHVAAELMRISETNRLIETAQSLRGVPREKAREIIRYVLKHPELSPSSCSSVVLESYNDTIEAMVFLFEIGEIINAENLVKIKKIDAKILNEEVNKILNITKIINIRFEGSTISLVVEKQILETIKNNYKEKSFKLILRKIINDIAISR